MNVPSTLLGLLLFVVLLLPGFAYTLRRERHRPERRISPFRETVSIVCASVVAGGAAILAFAALRIAFPARTPDVGALVRDPHGYLVTHYAVLAWWGLGLLLFAVSLAATGASPSVIRRAARVPVLDRMVQTEPHASAVSAWWLLFNEHPDKRIHVGCVLEDSSYVGGWLHSFATAAEDSPDREITLTAPISYRAAGEQDEVELPHVGAANVSARRIMAMTVSYIDTGDGDSDAGA